MAEVDTGRADSIGAGAPDLRDRYERGGEVIGRAPTIVGDGNGNLIFSLNGGEKLVSVEVFAEPRRTPVSSPE